SASSPTPGAGKFVTTTVTVPRQKNHPQAGKFLKIVLFSDGPRVNFDDVQLSRSSGGLLWQRGGRPAPGPPSSSAPGHESFHPALQHDQRPKLAPVVAPARDVVGEQLAHGTLTHQAVVQPTERVGRERAQRSGEPGGERNGET